MGEGVTAVHIRSSSATATSIASGVAMAALPKCPACVAAYLGVLSALGVDQWAPDYLWPLTYGLFGASLAFLAFRAWRREAYAPFVLASLGAGILLSARLADGSSSTLWTGFVLFALGVFWSAWAGRRSEPEACHTARAGEAWT